jgi:hypothetical protein
MRRVGQCLGCLEGTAVPRARTNANQPITDRLPAARTTPRINATCDDQ